MEGRKVTITKIFHAPIEDVWDAWTNPEKMKQWFSPEGMTTPEVLANTKIDGAYKITMEGHKMPKPEYNGIVTVGGTYLEIEKPSKLVFTWLWEGAPKDTHTTTVTVLLKKLHESQTELTLIHEGFPDDHMQQEHNMGWQSTCNKLEKMFG